VKGRAASARRQPLQEKPSDGYDDAAAREQGTRWLRDKLAEALRDAG
jgi:hypothetical protein